MTNNQHREKDKPELNPVRWKLWSFRAIMVLLSLSLAALFAEGALWLIAPVNYHEFMVWIPDGHIKGRARPNQVITNATGHDIRINHLGFRGPDWPLKHEPSTLRLITLGGSSTFNYHAQGEDRTWSSRVQYYLQQELDMPVEVINLGLPGFSLSTSKVNYLFTGRALNPHVVLVYHTCNDITPFRQIDKGLLPAHCFMKVAQNKPLWEFAARKTQIGRRTRNLLQARRDQQDSDLHESLEKPGEPANAPIGDPAFRWFEKNFRDLVMMAQGDNVLPVLISQATLVQAVNLNKPEIRVHVGNKINSAGMSVGMTMPVMVDTWSRCSQIIERVACESSAVFVNGRGAVPPDLDHLTDSVHLTDHGCDVLAQEVTKTLLEDRQFQHIVENVRKVPSSSTTSL